MKKVILLLAISSVLVISSQAQGLYFGASLGYGLKAGSATSFGNNKNADGSTDVVKVSLGAGFAPALSAGYLFNKNIGVELGLGYLIGAKSTITSYNNNGNSTTNINANSFFINPSFVIRAGEGKIIPYGKAGILLGLANSGTYDVNTYTAISTNVTKTVDNKTDFSGAIATGLTVNMGVDFMLSDNLAVFGEVFGRLASWSPASYTNTTTTTNSNPGTTTTNTNSSSGNYVNTMPANYTGTDQLSNVLPFSSVGLNVGVRYYLSK